MNLLIKTIVMTTALCFCLLATAEDSHDHMHHATHDMN